MVAAPGAAFLDGPLVPPSHTMPLRRPPCRGKIAVDFSAAGTYTVGITKYGRMTGPGECDLIRRRRGSAVISQAEGPAPDEALESGPQSAPTGAKLSGNRTVSGQTSGKRKKTDHR